MEIVPQARELSRIAKVFSALARAFSIPASIPIEPERIIVATDGGQIRQHCGVAVAVSGVCPICSTRLGPRDEP